jgi:hypothetical protein
VSGILAAAADKIDERVRAMGAGDERGAMFDDDGTAPLFIGMPISAQEGQDFADVVVAHVIETVLTGQAPLISALRGGIEHVLATGIQIGLDAQ